MALIENVGSNAVPILGVGFMRQLSLPSLQTLALGTQPPYSEKPKPQEESTCRHSSWHRQLNSQPMSIAVHANEPSRMFSPVEPSDDSNPSFLSDYKCMKPQVRTNQLGLVSPEKHEKINYRFKTFCIEMICYTAIGNWNNKQDF